MLKSMIVYSSQTGNTKKIAQAIHAGMSQLVEQCDIVPLKEINTRDLTGCDLIGLGSPVMHGAEPPYMRAFIEGIISLERKHSFVFCTHGALSGDYISRVVSALRSKGSTVIGWNDWYGNVSLPYMPKPYFTDGHPDDIDLKEAEDFGQEIAERSRRISRGEIRLVPTLPEGIDYDRLYGRFPRKWPQYLEKSRTFEFKINTEKCTQCGLCADNCPRQSIDFSISPPTLGTNCERSFYERCWLCEQICPEGAIEVDWEPVHKALRRYFQPLGRKHLSRQIFRASELAEAEGRFRRLVPEKDVGWDTPWYKVSGRPRIVIP